MVYTAMTTQAVVRKILIGDKEQIIIDLAATGNVTDHSIDIPDNSLEEVPHAYKILSLWVESTNAASSKFHLLDSAGALVAHLGYISAGAGSGIHSYELSKPIYVPPGSKIGLVFGAVSPIIAGALILEATTECTASLPVS